MLLGSVIYVDSPLIKYRTTVGISGNYAKHSHKERLFGVRAERLLAVRKQQYSDIAKHLGDTPTTKLALNLVKRQEFLLKFREQLSALQRMDLVLQSLKSSIEAEQILKAFLVYYTPKIFGFIILMQNKFSTIKNDVLAKN
jgi:hypothetical protein